jgi:hypothetical protein
MTDVHLSSFKDPHGSVVKVNNEILRIVNNNYKNEYDHLVNSGLFNELKKRNLIIDHTEIEDQKVIDLFSKSHFKVIRPTPVTITYPSEWSFSQLKDAALCTLNIQLTALKFNMVLKDCSAYNIQFHEGRPLLIDTLSFRFYNEGDPWFAYRQFCEHFYAPLLLIANVDPQLSSLFNQNIDGIPLHLAVKLLPFKTKLSLGVILHIVLHSRAKSKHKEKKIIKHHQAFNIGYVRNLTEDLVSRIEKIEWKEYTNWSLYYEHDVKTDYLKFKTDLIADLLSKKGSEKILDFGANDGTISRHLGNLGFDVISVDYDYASVDRNYRIVRQAGIKSVLPLVINAINPTPSFGWANSERQSFAERISVDTVVALALVHHLVIFYNIPFVKIAAYFASIANRLVVEFIPKSDPMTQILLQGKEDIYDFYSAENFQAAFCEHFAVVEKMEIQSSQRTLYYFENEFPV